MPSRWLLALAAALLLVRVPSLVQPMGPDQSLYAYVGDRIRDGGVAYRDAWDQKPPGIHYVYAVLRGISRADVMIPAADLAAAAAIAALLWRFGRRLGVPIAGPLAAVIFLALSDPALGRYGGMRVRAQAETFIALAVTAAVLLALAGRPRRLLFSGVLIGAAFALKYNAGIYGVVAIAAALAGGAAIVDLAWLAAGTAIVPLLLVVVFWVAGALPDLYQATVIYNLHYSGQTYAGLLDLARYLATFPIQRARLDALWFAGGLGSLALLASGIRNRLAWLPLVWLAAACISIAANGSRNLPQYFVQAAPALAIAAAMGAATAIPRLPRAARIVVIALLAVGVWRAGDDPFPKLAGAVAHDSRYLFGRIDRRAHLARYGGARDEDKYSALANADLGAFVASRTSPADTIYVFGFSQGVYVYSDRRSASRFFWSRPVILDFNHDDPAYGVAGLAADLDRARPAFVILQMRDWAPDVQDSGPFFLAQPRLAGWLQANYQELPSVVDGFQVWERRTP